MRPAISIVIPAAGSRDRFEHTLASLAQLRSASLEVIIEDQGSGFCDALDRGLACATADVLGYLGPGESLIPDAPHTIVGAIAAGHAAVMGGCVYVADPKSGIGIAQPADYTGRAGHLAVWERGAAGVAPPPVFWHRSLQQRLGGFAPGVEPDLAAFDLVCRLELQSAIHVCPNLWVARSIDASASPRGDNELLLSAIELSRRYWGSWLSPTRWKCAMSLRRYERHVHERARHHARRAEAAWAEGRRTAARIEWMRTWMLSPEMARERLDFTPRP